MCRGSEKVERHCCRCISGSSQLALNGPDLGGQGERWQVEGGGVSGAGGSQSRSSRMLPVSLSLHTYSCFCTPRETSTWVWVPTSPSDRELRTTTSLMTGFLPVELTALPLWCYLSSYQWKAKKLNGAHIYLNTVEFVNSHVNIWRSKRSKD